MKNNHLIQLLALFMVIGMFASPVYAAISTEERAALIAFYESTGGDDWYRNKGWKTPPLEEDGFALRGTEADWYGIVIENNQVSGIVFQWENNIEGPLPPDFFELPYIKKLTIKDNLLTKIPPEISNLSSLESLKLPSNGITTIPSEISSLEHLRILDLSRNELTQIPEEIGLCPNLVELHLDHNPMETVPGSLGKLEHLKVLTIFDANLKTLPSALGELSGLKRLELNQNPLETIPGDLGKLQSLETLSLGFTKLKTLPPELDGLSSLKQLDLNHIPSLEDIPYSALQGGQLEFLDLSSNRFSSIPEAVFYISTLKELDLSRNQLSNSLSPEIRNLSSLETLNLSYNQISWSLPPEIATLPSLKELVAQQSNLSGSLPEDIGKLSSLKVLDLASNHLSGSLPPEIGNLSSLETLELSGNLLSGPLPAEIGNLKNLSSLSLTNNEISGPIPEFIGNLENLAHLSLANNAISGPIPEFIGNLENLTHLYFGYNFLTGPIPESITQLVNLEDYRQTIAFGTKQGLSLDYNNLWVDDPAVLAFVNQKAGNDWMETQTRFASVTTHEAQAIGESSAVCGGEAILIDPDFSIIERGLCWREGDYGNPTCDDSSLSYTGDENPFSLAITDLSPGTHYTVSAWAKSSGGTVVYGEPITFSTFAFLPSGEREALIDLYESTAGDNWRLKHGWKDEPLEADGFGQRGREWTWEGVKINLGYWTSWPPSFETQLPTDSPCITGIELWYNNLNGPVPETIRNLSCLVSLELRGNQITAIPDDLWQLKYLIRLDLSENLITDLPPGISALENLYVLSLSHNRFQGTVPEEIGLLTNLVGLDISFNEFSGSLPETLLSLTNLAKRYGLGVEGNHLYTTNPEVLAFVDLKSAPGWMDTQSFIPVVEAGSSPSRITDDSAKIEFTVSLDGPEGTVTAVGISWSTDPDPNLDSNTLTLGQGQGWFSGALTGLQDQTTYHARAWASTRDDTVFSDDLTFRTGTTENERGESGSGGGGSCFIRSLVKAP